MGYKCTPQLMGLVRGDPKKGQKHRANGKWMLEEAGKERWSASETLDRTRSYLNTYQGVSNSGFSVWESMAKEANEYRVPTKLRNGTMAERGLRHDAVVGWAMIFNPPADMVEGWTSDDYRRFYHDSWGVMKEIEPRLFRDENVRLSAVHRDEGRMLDPETFNEHQHLFGVCKDGAGKFCGNLIDAKLMVTINKRFPSMMRERGWALDDLDMTDWERAKTDAAYRAERREKAKKNGRSVNKYIRDQLREQLQETIQLADALESNIDQTRSKQEQAEVMRKTALIERNKAEQDALEIRRRARRDAQTLQDEAKDKAQKVIDEARGRAEEEANRLLKKIVAEMAWKKKQADEDIQRKQDEKEKELQVREDSLQAQEMALKASLE